MDDLVPAPGIVVVPTSDRRPPICAVHGSRLSKISGRADREKDENWICAECPDPREVWEVAYIVRSAENRRKLTEAEAKKPGAIASIEGRAFAGDVVVSRDFRAVYVIAPDGSRRRCQDPEVAAMAVDYTKRALRKMAAGE